MRKNIIFLALVIFFLASPVQAVEKTKETSETKIAGNFIVKAYNSTTVALNNFRNTLLKKTDESKINIDKKYNSKENKVTRGGEVLYSAELFGLSIFSLILSSKIVFYLLLVALAFLIIRFIIRKIT